MGIVTNLFLRPVGLIPVLKSRDEYYYVENKYQGLFIPCVKSRDTLIYVHEEKELFTLFVRVIMKNYLHIY